MTLVEARPRGAAGQPPSPRRVRLDPRVGPALIVVLAAITAAHAAVVAPAYHVGSFDDDGHYLALAHALRHGHGLVDTSLPGSPTETLYPPGYPALLVPLLWAFGGAYWPLRVLSAVAMVACVPLADLLFRQHRVPTLPRLFALTLFALSPVAATFATMVMPEAIFLVVLLGVLLALPRWERSRSLVTPAGVVVAVGAPLLLLLKAAAAPMLVGVIGWLALRRQWRRAATVVATSAVLLAPVAIAKLTAGSVVGDRYLHEYSTGGGILTRLGFGVHHYVTDAIPESILQWFATNLQHHGPVVGGALDVFRYTAAPLVILGWVAWLRLRPDATVLIVPLYLAETVPFPYINERRVILLLPVVLAWYALGWWAVGALLRRWRPWRSPATVAAYAALPGLVLVPVAMQFGRNYLLSYGEHTSAPAGSGYAAALRAVTPPGWSIGTSYRWSMSLFTGRTASNHAFLDLPCPRPDDTTYADRVRQVMRIDHVATVLDGALNRPNRIDSRCVLATLSAAPWAVEVYDGADKSSVWLLLGAGTARPDARVAVAAAQPAAATPLAAATRVDEVSIEAAYDGGVPVALQLREPGGRWVTVAAGRTAPDGVLLHARFATPVTADAVRAVAPSGVDLDHLVVLSGR